ncbi:MAG: (2Fe-2S)-binding protein [Defluviicoccus sp.]|nr:(2Fe-2S)-binding protein [Defluviicoccus sp.]MDE0276946.1 (2Fe-2S)-binding protein [Defluviicoccus sp.]
MSEAIPISLTVNGRTHRLFVQPWHTLLQVLREQILLTGSKRGCNQGVCGACSVTIDGAVVRGCLTLAVNATDREIVTVEGLAAGNELSPVQQALLDRGAVQCGFCMPGMAVAATALLADNPDPSDDEIRDGLSGNLCRCSGYVKVIEAVRSASAGGAS